MESIEIDSDVFIFNLYIINNINVINLYIIYI